jgi:hypothetical protein
MNLKAQEGQWYLQRWSRETFCVIGVDEDFRVVDVRDANGDVDEFPFDEWEIMDLEACPPPELLSMDGELDGDDFEFSEPVASNVHGGPRFASD